jgi:Male sterility protein.
LLLFFAVISTLEEPISGWLDNYNGPVGMFLAGGKGLLRTVHADPNITSDFMPVDVCIKFMLVASWLKAISG